MISFIIPAHNEELWIGMCLDSIRTTMEDLGEQYEVIVVDDASNDATPLIAQRMGATTLCVEHRKIAAVRNSGAAAACGELFFFVDADTQINARAVREALKALRQGAAGGGCLFDLSGPIPLWGNIIHKVQLLPGRLLRLAGGCCLFCTRDAYHVTGGFSERLHAGEDLDFIQALKRIGRFVVPKSKVVTSGRKFSVAGPWKVIGLLLTIAIRGPRYENKWVLDILYGRRAQECKKPGNVIDTR